MRAATIDGDTAQVGPGIATRLGYTQLTLVDQIQNVDLKAKKRIRYRSELEGRHEILEALLPGTYHRSKRNKSLSYPTVPMRLTSETAEVLTWDNKILKLDEQTIGLKGSNTSTENIFS